MEPTTFRDFSSASVGQAAPNGPILDFTDQRGKSGALKGGYGQLIALTEYKQAAEVPDWLGQMLAIGAAIQPDRPV